MFSFRNRNDDVEAGTDARAIRHTTDNQNVEDLEDIRANGKTSFGGPRPVVRCYDANDEQRSSKTIHQTDCPQQESDCGVGARKVLGSLRENDISKENVDRNVDYEGWLELKKRKWRETREKRKRQRYF